MNSYKIKVNSKDESKEVQELFESLGYEKGACSLGNYPAVIVTTQDWATGNYCSTRALGLDIPAHKNYIEITLAGLRDMVVLKRNDVNDATHINTVTDSKVLQQGNKNYYWYSGEWHLYPSGVDIRPIEKPIINPLKEYLVPQGNGKYALTKATKKRVSDWIEIPVWANYAYKNDAGICFLKGALGFNHPLLVWQRPTQPEELPFIDDEPKYTDDEVKYMDDNGQGRLQLINDQYAEIEQVGQHSHYKKDVSNLEFIDVYRVLKLFDVTDPCLQHAIKKLLCSGQRGAKSSDQDVQEAIDSLVRFQQMRIEDSLD